MAREELSWSNLEVETLPAGSKKALNNLLSSEAIFREQLEKDLKAAKLMPSDKYLVVSRKGGSRIGVAFSAEPHKNGGGKLLSFKK